MTTIRDMLLASLREIGADGVACLAPTRRGGMRVYSTDILWQIRSSGMLLDARPAFRDDDGRLVPLPEWWEVGDECLTFGDYDGWAMVEQDDAGSWTIERGVGQCTFGGSTHPTAPAAWRAAEQWIKDSAPEARKEDQ